MSDRPITLLLDDILESAAKITSYTAGMERVDFMSSGMAADAVVRNLEVIGEAANRLPAEFTDKHPEIEWRKIIGLRHRIVHDYCGVDLDIIWIIVHRDLPDLVAGISALNHG